MMPSAENMGNFPLKRASTRGMLLEKPGQRSALEAGSEPGQGQGPGCTVPPTVPGAPLLLDGGPDSEHVLEYPARITLSV